MRIWPLIALVPLLIISCAKDRPYLAGHIKRAQDAIMVPCDPYGLGKTHQCVVFAAAFRENLYVYDATAGEMVLSPMSYFPLKIRVGQSVDHLVAVMSEDARVPFMFAVDRNEATLYPVRLFAHEKEKSFSEPKPEKLNKVPFKMAALDQGDKIIMIATQPNEGGIEIMAINRTTGQQEKSVAPKTISFGTKPSQVEIHRDRKVAVFSDESESALHVLDLSNIDDVLTKGAAHNLKTIALNAPVDRIHLSKRDFGLGSHIYAVAQSANANEIFLVDINGEKLEDTVSFDEFPMATYFPDDASSPCCSGKASWFSVVTIKGGLHYVLINQQASGMKLEKSNTVTDLTSENNLVLSKLHVRKIIGGYIEPDKSVEREPLCSSHRQTFYIASYGNSRSYLHIEPVEVEAHGYSCEGDASAARFGHKAN